MLQLQCFQKLEWMSLQDRFQEDPVHMAMIISRNLKEEERILDTAKTTEVKPAAQDRIYYTTITEYEYLVKACLCSRRVSGCHQPCWWRNKNWMEKWKS